ncbi:hypothetical protein ACQK5W_04040 [Pantoea sp. FN060301]|uniref:hypothetical protein n=1 Tax=Pantoea sp. FN060301 TaxID=3420380 RepID=UPI003D186F57
MTPEQIQKLRELRNALACWQDDYDPTEDKEQYDMFGAAVDAIALVEGLQARVKELEESHAQVIEARDHYKNLRMSSRPAAAVFPPEKLSLNNGIIGFNEGYNQAIADTIALSGQPQKCCQPTREELASLARGDFTPEELWGGPRPSCPKCAGGEIE